MHLSEAKKEVSFKSDDYSRNRNKNKTKQTGPKQTNKPLCSKGNHKHQR